MIQSQQRRSNKCPSHRFSKCMYLKSFDDATINIWCNEIREHFVFFFFLPVTYPFLLLTNHQFRDLFSTRGTQRCVSARSMALSIKIQPRRIDSDAQLFGNQSASDRSNSNRRKSCCGQNERFGNYGQLQGTRTARVYRMAGRVRTHNTPAETLIALIATAVFHVHAQQRVRLFGS